MESECECESYREQVSERERQRSIYMAADFVDNVGRVNHLRAAGPINRSEVGTRETRAQNGGARKTE